MYYPDHKTHDQTFEGGMNSDLAPEVMRSNMSRLNLNCRVLSSAQGNVGVVVNNLGTTLITTPLPAGQNKTIGSRADERHNCFYFAVWNSNKYHTWYRYDEALNQIVSIIQNLTDTDGIDILKFDPKFPILSIDFVPGRNQVTGQESTLFNWCDGLNKARKTNIEKCLDKSISGYGYNIEEDFITAYKKAPLFAPVVANSPIPGVSGYWTDLSRNSNFLYAQLFKFCYRYIYDDGEISNYSDFSMVALPQNQSYQGIAAITTDNNVIAVQINTGSKLVYKIEIVMQGTGSRVENGVTLQGAVLPWKTIAILNKAELALADNANFSYNFYNDGSFAAADETKVNRPYSFMFRVPVSQAFTGLAMTQTGGDEGFPRVPVKIGVVNKPVPLFIPFGTVNETNSPSLTVVQNSYTVVTGFLTVAERYNPVILFTVGADVKAGNVFSITGRNTDRKADALGLHRIKGSDHYSFSYTATLADTALSVANRIKGYLRSIGRGIPDGKNGISAENSIGGNASFMYSYLGKWAENITTFTGSATPVQFKALQDNGISVQLIKSGSKRQYAVGYEDDDGRKSDAYTIDSAIITTPFLTEAPGGVLQQPIHEVSIYSQPPIWARRWILYRTPDEVGFIHLLIQKVIDVRVIASANPGEYLDLVVGSLFTYQKIHPDVILSYSFKRGDRLRLIKNQITDTYYRPFFETDVLSYNEVTTELRNAQITVYGTDHVTPSDGVLTDYVGKNIQINGIERTIIDISGGDYILDNIINIGPVMITSIQPNYNFIDRRGIIRIAKPPATYSVVDYSTIEVYTPQASTDNLDYKQFYDTAQKFDISNPGTSTRAHRGTHQDQDGTDAASLEATPAVVLVSEGDVYGRSREMPSNNSIIDTEVLVDFVEDPNFSDFYPSSLNNLGRVYPKDDGKGQHHFGSRTRFSSDYIADTAINGLNDYNNVDREDYNDAYGDAKLTKLKENRLYIFKPLKVGWLPIFRSIINTAQGSQIIALSNKLLGPIEYCEYGDGIGNSPESWFESDRHMYHAAPTSGTFVQITGAGIEPISKIYGYNDEARAILKQVKKFNVPIVGGFDKQNDEVIWSLPQYIAPIFNGPINKNDWVTTEPVLPGGATVVIVTQPANGVVTYNGATGSFEINMNADFVGTDTFTYKFSLVAGGFSAIKNGCINSIEAQNVLVDYQAKVSTKYCTQAAFGGGFDNDGNESYTVLEGYFLEDLSLTGNIMPNIAMISTEAIVPAGTTITYHETANVAPSAGADGDVWFNEPEDGLYKKIAGVWTALTDRVVNQYFIAPVQNLGDCPLPAPTNTFAIKNNSTTKAIQSPSIKIDAVNYANSITVVPGATVVAPVGAGGGVSTVIFYVGNGFQPSSAALTAAGYGPIAGTWTGSFTAGYITFPGVDMTANHTFTITINP